jgi:hypothetical protein
MAQSLPDGVFNNLCDSFAMGLAQDDADEAYYWLLETIAGLQQKLLSIDSAQSELHYRYHFVEHLHMTVRNRLSGSLSELASGHYYGLVFVDGSTKVTRDLSRRIVIELSQQRPTNLTLMLHHMGNPIIIQQIDGNHTQPDSRYYETSHARLPVIGPALRRYAKHQAQVAFVMVITPEAIIDYTDWIEMEEGVWPYLTWMVLTSSDWMPLRGDLINYDDGIVVPALVRNLYAHFWNAKNIMFNNHSTQ